MYTISFSSFVLIVIFYARPLTETKWKGLYPRKSDTSNSVWENVGYDGWVGVSSGEVRVELWGMPVSYLQIPKIYSQHFKKKSDFYKVVQQNPVNPNVKRPYIHCTKKTPFILPQAW